MVRTKGILLVTTFLCFLGVISATCPSSTYSDLKHTLQSPGFNTNNSTVKYPPNQNCTYNIRVSAGKRIILAFDFKVFEIWGSMPNCSQDSLEIIVGCGDAYQTSLGKFCSCSNLSMPDKIYTYDNCLTLVFISDGSHEGRGFQANYTTTDNNVTRLDPNNNCSSNDLVTPSHGTIFSPFWPLKYPALAECRWQFSPPSGKIVRLFFTSSVYQGNSLCRDHSRPIADNDQVVLSYGINTTAFEDKYRICFLPDNFFVIENVTAIRLLFSSNDDRGDKGTGFMAGYATYVEGKVDPDTGGCWRPPAEGTTSTTWSTTTTTDKASTNSTGTEKKLSASTTPTPERNGKLSASTAPTPERNGKLSGGVIAAIGIGAVLGVLIFGALVWYIICCCKKKKTSAETKGQIPLR
ncbi:dorsal-ventral patterning tolloid-like protein 1 isoform X2 [Porites lutea]|uniref:dorsal-ventral patterning tolloid-like protein 1 isoform X2 n=1 Tax=Porites lutea TaxID=51062 RepID=UPI003CC5AC2F